MKTYLFVIERSLCNWERLEIELHLCRITLFRKCNTWIQYNKKDTNVEAVVNTLEEKIDLMIE